MLTIGIDIGGTNIKVGLVRDGKVAGKRTLDALSQRGLKPQLRSMEDTIGELLSEHNVSIRQLAGIGMSIPGIVDSTAKKVLVINDKFNDVVGLDLAQWARSAFGLPLAIDNDARCALIGEWQYGAGKGCNNLVMVTLGTGLGTAAVVEGRVLRGSHHLAGILGGHFIIDRHGLQCNCGNRGCAEAQASTWNLREIVRSLGVSDTTWAEYPDFRIIFEKAARGDDTAVKVRDHCIDIWTTAIVNLIYAYDPERIVMSGGIMQSADIIMPSIREQMKQYGWAPFDEVELVCSSVFEEAAMLSAEYFLSAANSS